MGKALTYCFKCSKLIREEEFAKGKAFNLGDRVSCSDCAREVGAVVVPGAPAPPPPPVPTPRKIVIVREFSASTKPVLLLAVGGFAFVAVVIAMIVAFSRTSETPLPANGAASPSPREVAARQALEAARKAGEVKTKRRAMERVATDYGDTAAGAEAKKELAVLQNITRELWQRDLQTLEEKLREPLARRKFETAAGLIEEALKLDTDPAWTEPLQKRLKDVREEGAKMDADLVGHWTFDEGQGFKAQDSSGQGAVGEIKNATWVDGRLGKALRFAGGDAYVELPNTPELDGITENSYTIAAWFKPEAEAVPSGYPMGLVIKGGRHSGLTWRTRFTMDFYLADSAHLQAAYLNPPHPPGRFYHVAGVVDRSQGLVRIVVDGKELGTRKFSPAAKGWPYRTMRWRIGLGYPNARQFTYPATGVIDDVRLYKRALSEEEIQRLIPKG